MLATGTRLGSYEVLGSLGAGGMGEVYRARDTRLGRDVAIKALPATVAGDPERTARFEREAKVLASLNHPHIGAIYGLEETAPSTGSGQAGSRYLILELIEGQSLAEILGGHGHPAPAAATPSESASRGVAARGGGAPRALNLDEAVRIARQILEALEAAHDKGIIHRDLKPANIMLTAEGEVKVLDFGLARVADEDASRDVTNSPTLTATQVGVILGTAAYMSPEQARGRVADKRSDVWAFGCVFFEMLTGKRLFDGEDVSETLAFVLTKAPDWSALPASVPPRLQTLLKRCLERDRKARIPDVSAVRFLLDEAVSEPTAANGLAEKAARPPARARLLLVTGGMIAALGLGGAASWYLKPVPAPPIGRFEIALPPSQQFVSMTRRAVAISPDGLRIAYFISGGLAVRALSEFYGKVIPGTEQNGAAGLDPVFSPDGRMLAFYSIQDRALKRVAVTGGPVETICKMTVATSGISWDGDALVFAENTGGPGAGIKRVSPNGGTPEPLVAPDQVTTFFDSPQILPGGDALLFTESPAGPDRWDKASIVVKSVKSGQTKTLLTRASAARYQPTGHLVFATAGQLVAVPMDLRSLTVGSARVTLVEGVRRSQGGVTGVAHYSISNTGTLVYLAGPASGTTQSDLGMTDKLGTVTTLKLSLDTYEYPRVSPDGKRIVFTSEERGDGIVWVHDLGGAGAPRRLTFGGDNRFPIWSSDGKRVTYQSNRDGERAIYWQAADGNSTPERLTFPEHGQIHIPDAWSPKGDRLAFDVIKGPNTPMSLQMLSMPDRRVTAFDLLGQNSTLPSSAVFSPDGRWIAYTIGSVALAGVGSDSTMGIYVQPVPPTGARFQLFSRDRQEHHPLWTPDGKELLYVGLPGTLWAVSVTTQPSLVFGNPVARPRAFPIAAPTTPRTFDITPDGRIVSAVTPQLGAFATATQMAIVTNWFEELKAKVK